MHDDDDVIPTLLAFRDRDRWRVYCDHCGGPHFHRQLGLQGARCGGWTPFTAHGYILIDGGRGHSGRTVRYSNRTL
jgi:hypothetical protein